MEKSKPKFKGQEPSPCGCYYPDAMRVTDVLSVQGIHRILFCREHGVTSFLISLDKLASDAPKEAFDYEGERSQALEKFITRASKSRRVTP